MLCEALGGTLGKPLAEALGVFERAYQYVFLNLNTAMIDSDNRLLSNRKT